MQAAPVVAAAQLPHPALAAHAEGTLGALLLLPLAAAAFCLPLLSSRQYCGCAVGAPTLAPCPPAPPPIHSFTITTGVGFSGSGFLLFYFFGVLQTLKHDLGIITPATKMAGSSGGAIAAVAGGCSGLAPEKLLSDMLETTRGCRARAQCYVSTAFLVVPWWLGSARGGGWMGSEAVVCWGGVRWWGWGGSTAKRRRVCLCRPTTFESRTHTQHAPPTAPQTTNPDAQHNLDAAVRTQLTAELPPDAAARCSSTGFVAVTQVVPGSPDPGVLLGERYSSKADVVAASEWDARAVVLGLGFRVLGLGAGFGWRCGWGLEIGGTVVL